MKPSEALHLHRRKILALVRSHKATNPRVFGSTIRGEDTESSDLDLLVDPLPGATLLDLGAIQAELEDLLRVRIDVLTPGDLPPKIRAQVLSEAVRV